MMSRSQAGFPTYAKGFRRNTWSPRAPQEASPSPSHAAVATALRPPLAGLRRFE